jgi:hypothetical protein
MHYIYNLIFFIFIYYVCFNEMKKYKSSFRKNEKKSNHTYSKYCSVCTFYFYSKIIRKTFRIIN